MSVVLGVSSCLLGRPVRYDGGHKRDDFVVDVLGPVVRFVAVCPEVELGLGTPRKTLRLVKAGPSVRMVMSDGQDYTEAMREYAATRLPALDDDDLDGYILKDGSPSCGSSGVSVRDEHGRVRSVGRGLFAAALVGRFARLPVVGEGELADRGAREHFLVRVFAHRRLKTLFAQVWTVGDLVEFHSKHKLLLLAHSTDAYRALGRLVAGARDLAPIDVQRRYGDVFMRALAAVPTSAQHVNVLQHMAGYFRDSLEVHLRHKILDCVEDYRCGLVGRDVPLSHIREQVERLGLAYLSAQWYLPPYPPVLSPSPSP